MYMSSVKYYRILTITSKSLIFFFFHKDADALFARGTHWSYLKIKGHEY